MARTNRPTAAQLKTLRRIWTEPTASGCTDLSRRGYTYLINTADAAKAGFGKLNGNSASSLLEKGLIRELVTKVDGPNGTKLVLAILTDAGRAAIGV